MLQERVSVVSEEAHLSHAMFWSLSIEFKKLGDLIGPAKPIT